MKKLLLILSLSIAISTVTSLSSCSPKVGCELNEEVGPKVNKRGELSTKRGNSNLFDKKRRKSMGKY